MTKMDDKKQKLFIKFIDNNLSKEEKLEFENIKNSDKEYENECKELYGIYHYTKKLAVPEFDYKPFQNKEKNIYNLLNYRWLKVAIILIVGVCIGIAAVLSLFNNKDQFLRVATERGDKIKVDLPDGITIWLNSRSEITYNGSFSGSNRVIKLKGEGFISISENTSPFIVKSINTEIICTNGSFNIENDTLLNTTQVEVKSGWVAIRNPNTNNQQFIIEKGYKGIVNDYIPIWIEQNAAPNYLAWHTGKLSFIKTTLKEVAEVLMEVYDVDIKIVDESRFCLITKTYVNQDLNTILKELQSTFDIQIKRNDHNIIITGNPC